MDQSRSYGPLCLPAWYRRNAKKAKFNAEGATSNGLKGNQSLEMMYILYKACCWDINNIGNVRIERKGNKRMSGSEF